MLLLNTRLRKRLPSNNVSGLAEAQNMPAKAIEARLMLQPQNTKNTFLRKKREICERMGDKYM